MIKKSLFGNLKLVNTFHIDYCLLGRVIEAKSKQPLLLPKRSKHITTIEPLAKPFTFFSWKLQITAELSKVKTHLYLLEQYGTV